MLHRAIIAVRFALKLGRLKLRVGAHARLAILARELKHREVERMETRQRDELKLVAHQSQLFLKLRNRALVELLLPVERRRKIVSQQLAGKLLVKSMRKTARVFEIRFRRLAPNDIRVRRVSECARDRLIQAGFNAEEAFSRALAGQERVIAFVDVAREQARAVRVSARNEN